jgi:hypothetical protein
VLQLMILIIIVCLIIVLIGSLIQLFKNRRVASAINRLPFEDAMSPDVLPAIEASTKLGDNSLFGAKRKTWFSTVLDRAYRAEHVNREHVSFVTYHYAVLLAHFQQFLATQTKPDAELSEGYLYHRAKSNPGHPTFEHLSETLFWLRRIVKRQNKLHFSRTGLEGVSTPWDADLVDYKPSMDEKNFFVVTRCSPQRITMEIQRLKEFVDAPEHEWPVIATACQSCGTFVDRGGQYCHACGAASAATDAAST